MKYINSDFLLGILIPNPFNTLLAWFSQISFLSDMSLLHSRDLPPIIDISNLSISITQNSGYYKVHSHNTYDNGGMIGALQNGCQSIEADVWNFPSDSTFEPGTSTVSTTNFYSDQLYIGHTADETDGTKTLDSLYLDALYKILETSNQKFNDPRSGVFYDYPKETIHLLIDSKVSADLTYPLIQKYMKRFIDKGWLTYFDNRAQKWIYGPLTVVLTGDLPSVEVLDQEPIRFYTLDGDLTLFTDNTDSEVLKNVTKYSVIASGSMTNCLQGATFYEIRNFSDLEKKQLSTLFTNAEKYGIKSRIWGGDTIIPSLETAENNVLYGLGEALVNVDDVTQASNYPYPSGTVL